jgi:two-component system sensor histidine kinase YesM
MSKSMLRSWLRRAALSLSFRKSIQGKVFVVLCMMTLSALFFLGYVIYYNLSDNIRTNAITYVMDSIRRADDNFRVTLVDATNIMAQVTTDQEHVISVLQSEHQEISYDWFQEYRQIDNFMSYMIAYKSHINRISIVGTNGIIYSHGAPYLDRMNLNETLVQQIYEAADEGLFIKQHYNGREQTITLGRKINFNRDTIGVVMVDLNYSIFGTNYDIRPSADSFVFVLDASGERIFDATPDNKSTDLDLQADLQSLLKLAVNKNDVQKVRLLGKNQLVISAISPYTGWTTVGIIPEQAIMEDSHELARQIIQVLVVISIAVLIVSMALTSRLTLSLRRLQKAMRSVEEGNFFVVAKINSVDEVGQFYNGMQSMLKKLRTLMDDLKERERLKREAELAALQAQIRPHFLYNSLNTIKYMAVLNDAKNIEEVSGSLIEMLRGVLGNTREFIPLREELHYVQSYLNIQKYKYRDKFRVQFQIPDEMLELTVLKLTIQPLVENAIMHGVSDLEEGGLIAIRVFREHDCIHVEVTDNGKGMTEEEISKSLLLDTMQEHFREGGMGIRNVNERIKMVYGDQYGVQIYSRINAYTKAIIMIPYPVEVIDIDQDYAGR